MNCSDCSTTCSTSAATRRASCLSVQPTDLVELCEHVAAVHWSKARSRHLQLRLALDPALPALMELDPHRVQQVLHNLLSNAIKFSERGEVVPGPGGRGVDFVQGG